MNIWELKVQRLKRNIEETREKLNVLMDQDVPYITKEIMATNKKLDIMIKDYYCNCKSESAV